MKISIVGNLYEPKTYWRPLLILLQGAAPAKREWIRNEAAEELKRHLNPEQLAGLDFRLLRKAVGRGAMTLKRRGLIQDIGNGHNGVWILTTKGRKPLDEILDEKSPRTEAQQGTLKAARVARRTGFRDSYMKSAYPAVLQYIGSHPGCTTRDLIANVPEVIDGYDNPDTIHRLVNSMTKKMAEDNSILRDGPKFYAVKSETQPIPVVYSVIDGQVAEEGSTSDSVKKTLDHLIFFSGDSPDSDDIRKAIKKICTTDLKKVAEAAVLKRLSELGASVNEIGEAGNEVLAHIRS